MLVYLTTGDSRDMAMQALLSTQGIQPDTVRSAYGDPEVCDWIVQDAPCLLWLHNGKAVLQIASNDPMPEAGDLPAMIDAAVAAYEDAHAGPA